MKEKQFKPKKINRWSNEPSTIQSIWVPNWIPPRWPKSPIVPVAFMVAWVPIITDWVTSIHSHFVPNWSFILSSSLFTWFTPIGHWVHCHWWNLIPIPFSPFKYHLSIQCLLVTQLGPREGGIRTSEGCLVDVMIQCRLSPTPWWLAIQTYWARRISEFRDQNRVALMLIRMETIVSWKRWVISAGRVSHSQRGSVEHY